MELLVVTLVMSQLLGVRLTSLVPTATFLDPTVMQKGIFFLFFSRRYPIFQGLPVGLLFYLKWV